MCWQCIVCQIANDWDSRSAHPWQEAMHAWHSFLGGRNGFDDADENVQLDQQRPLVQEHAQAERADYFTVCTNPLRMHAAMYFASAHRHLQLPGACQKLDG